MKNEKQNNVKTKESLLESVCISDVAGPAYLSVPLESQELSMIVPAQKSLECVASDSQ